MSDESGFLKSLDRTPDDHTPYVVFADWLQEHGRDHEANGLRSLARMGLHPDATIHEVNGGEKTYWGFHDRRGTINMSWAEYHAMSPAGWRPAIKNEYPDLRLYTVEGPRHSLLPEAWFRVLWSDGGDPEEVGLTYSISDSASRLIMMVASRFMWLPELYQTEYLTGEQPLRCWCPPCEGDGWVSEDVGLDTNRIHCPPCLGLGWVAAKACDLCKGKGRIFWDHMSSVLCKTCNGEGKVPA